MTDTKTGKYRQALEDLGLDVPFATFAEYCKSKLGMDSVADSSFYAIRKEMRDEAAAISEEPKQASHSLAVTDLPALLQQTRDLLAKFGDDKEALIGFIRAV